MFNTSILDIYMLQLSIHGKIYTYVPVYISYIYVYTYISGN